MKTLQVIGLLILSAILYAVPSKLSIPELRTAAIDLITGAGSVLQIADNRQEKAVTCKEYTPFGVPMDSDLLLCKRGFAIGYSKERKAPDWTSIILTGENAKNYIDRSSMQFEEDASIMLESRATLQDFRGSGYDRGHMVASADADWSKESHADSFLLSNISAQHPDLNQQGWVKIEKASRALAMKYNTVNIITGAAYLDETKTIGLNHVAVPSHYFKVVYAPEHQKTWAWIVPNQPVPSNKAYKYRVTVDEVEEFTGLDLFNQLSSELQSKIEGRKFDL